MKVTYEYHHVMETEPVRSNGEKEDQDEVL